MKIQGWEILGTSITSTFFALSLFAGNSAEARDIKTIWLARLSGQTQCATRQAPPALSGAVTDLEDIDAVVLEAKLGSLTDRAFCSSCSCPLNLFHVAKVSADPESIESALADGWLAIDPKAVATPAASEVATKGGTEF